MEKNGGGNFKLLYKRGFVGYNKSAMKALRLKLLAAFVNDFCRGRQKQAASESKVHLSIHINVNGLHDRKEKDIKYYEHQLERSQFSRV